VWAWYLRSKRIVTYMSIVRQRLRKHIPEAYALNKGRVSIAR
jgi:hypothetical protein